MSKSNHATLTAYYRLGEFEVIQCTVTVPNAYPDVLREAKATVLAMMHDELADVIAQTVVEEPAGE